MTVPKIISSDDTQVKELEPQAPFVQPGDFVAGILKMPTAEVGLYIVEVWGPGEMIQAEQEWRSAWWMKAFGLVIILMVIAFVIGYLGGAGFLW